MRRQRFAGWLIFWLLIASPVLAIQEPDTTELKAFADVTDSVGLHGVGGGTAAWADFDADGWTDLAADGVLWRNQEGRFKRVDGVHFGASVIWGDVDNDGDLDCFSMSGKVFLNQENSFMEVEKAIPEMPRSPMTSTWIDINQDGLLDLYVTGYEGGGYHPDFLYENMGNGKFKILFRGPAQPGRGVTACDYDEDGDMDLYVSNYRLVPNALLNNDGRGNLKDVSKEAKVDGDGGLGAWGHTIGSSWGDFDNDGHFDLFAGNFSHPPAYQDRPKFYQNLGKAASWAFADRSSDAGLHWQESYASPTLGDFDNDGRLDLFFTTVYQGDHSVLYRNMGNWKFQNVSRQTGIGRPLTYQAAWADFNNDGFLDMIHGGRLFQNPGGKNKWVKIQLSGSGKVNRAAIGAQLRITSGKSVITRQVESATGQGNQNDLVVHFGLGINPENLKLEILWPDGKRQQVDRVTPGQTMRIQKK